MLDLSLNSDKFQLKACYSEFNLQPSGGSHEKEFPEGALVKAPGGFYFPLERQA